MKFSKAALAAVLILALGLTGCASAGTQQNQGWFQQAKQRVYASCGYPKATISHPEWSGDGSHLIYQFVLEALTTHPDHALYVAEISNNTTTIVSIEDNLIDYALFPDGSQLLFVMRSLSGDFFLNQFSLNQEDEWVLVESNQFEGYFFQEPSVSPTGIQIAYSGASYGSIYVMNLTDGSIRQLTFGPQDLRLSWSPDGQQIAFVSASYDLGVVDLEGTKVDLTTNISITSNLRWSPNSHQIAFLGYREENPSSTLMVVDVDHPNSARQVIQFTRLIADFRWLPDSQEIVYFDYDKIGTVSINGQNQRNLSTLSSFVSTRRHTFAPDGSKLAFIGIYPNKAAEELFVMNVDGSNLSQLTENPANKMCFHWPF